MNTLECPVCGSSNIQTERRLDGFHHCMNCRHSWKLGESQLKPTVFQKITTSPEVLAVEFVGMMYDRVAGDYRYYSMLTGEFYNSREAAIAATLERLKEVEKDEK